MPVKHVTALGAKFNHDPPDTQSAPSLRHNFSSRVMTRNKDARNEEWNEEQR